jgi:hypothetical protein
MRVTSIAAFLGKELHERGYTNNIQNLSMGNKTKRDK